MTPAGPLGLYHPGDSVVHRTGPGAKLLALAALGLALAVLPGPWPAVAALVGAAGLAAVARLPWRAVLRATAPVAVVAVLAGAYQWWSRGPQAAVGVAATLLALVLAATVLTATTRTDRLLDTLVGAARPLRRIGVDPDTLALAAALALRTVPDLARTVAETRDAASARGLERHPRALLVPGALRAVGRARAVGEALTARGIGD